MNGTMSKSSNIFKKEKDVQFIQKFEQFYKYFKESIEIHSENSSYALSQKFTSHFGAILPPWFLLPLLQWSRKERYQPTNSDTNGLMNEPSQCTSFGQNSFAIADNPLDLSKPSHLNQQNSSYLLTNCSRSNDVEMDPPMDSFSCCSSSSDSYFTQTLMGLVETPLPSNTTNALNAETADTHVITHPSGLMFGSGCFKPSHFALNYPHLPNQPLNPTLPKEDLNSRSKSVHTLTNHKSGLRKCQTGTSKARKLDYSNGKLVTHNLDSNPGKQPITRCHQCKVLFSSLDELNGHFMREHDQILQAELQHTKSWKSHAIEDSCFQSLKFTIARYGVVNSFGYPCPHCDYVAKWPTELQKHIMVHSKQRPHRCIICGLSYKWKWDLGRHFDKSHQTTLNPYKKNGYTSTNGSGRGKQKRVNSLVKLLNTTTCSTDHFTKLNSHGCSTVSAIPTMSSMIKTEELLNL